MRCVLRILRIVSCWGSATMASCGTRQIYKVAPAVPRPASTRSQLAPAESAMPEIRSSQTSPAQARNTVFLARRERTTPSDQQAQGQHAQGQHAQGQRAQGQRAQAPDPALAVVS
jgi:hypothetical protein